MNKHRLEEGMRVRCESWEVMKRLSLLAFSAGLPTYRNYGEFTQQQWIEYHDEWPNLVWSSQSEGLKLRGSSENVRNFITEEEFITRLSLTPQGDSKIRFNFIR